MHLALLTSFQHVDVTFEGGEDLRGWLASLAEMGRLFSIIYDLIGQGYL